MVWSRSAVQKIRDAVQYVDSLSRNTPDGRAARPVPQSPEIRIVNVTSTTPDDDGYWPGDLKSYTVGSGLSTNSSVVVTTRDGSTPAAGYHEGMWVGAKDDGTPILLLLTGQGIRVEGTGSAQPYDSLSNRMELDFNSDDGFRLSGAGVPVTIDFASASLTEKGAVDTADQYFLGYKSFWNDITVGYSNDITFGLGKVNFLSEGSTFIGGFGGGSGWSGVEIRAGRWPQASFTDNLLRWQLDPKQNRMYIEATTSLTGTFAIAISPDKGSTIYTGQTGTYAGLEFYGGILKGGSFTGGSSYTDEQAQDAVGSILTDSSNIDFTYDDAANTITADLTDTGISPGTYAQIHVDAKGRATSGQATLDATNLGLLNTLGSATPDSADLIPFYDTSAAANKQCAVSVLLALILPSGTILPFGGSTIPTGFLECDGSAVSRSTYTDLFSAIGTTWGAGDGSTTFNLPDLRGRSPLGAGTGSGLTARTLGGTGGVETVALATSELPSHNHQIKGADGNTIYKYSAGGANPRVAGAADSSSSTVYTSENAGSGSAHANMHPYAVTKFMIKT